MSHSTIRNAERRRIQCDLSAHLVIGDERHALRCIATDVSRSGLGVVGFSELQAGSEAILVLKERGVPLKVIWCKPDTVREAIFHIGLQCQDPKHNLEALLESEGLIASGSGLSFKSLQPIIATLHTHDATLLRSDALLEYATRYRAFPFNYQGQSLVALLPPTIKPRDVATLSELSAIEHVVILRGEKGGRWRQLWPERREPEGEGKVG